jgi:hypothetical protein
MQLRDERNVVTTRLWHGKSHYGYKNHVNVDRKHKLVRRYHVSYAALHDRWDGCRPPPTASQCAKVVV